MKNGVKIIRKTDHGYKSTFFPEELVEIHNLNSRIQTRLASQALEEANEQARNAELAQQAAKRERKIGRIVRRCAALFAVGTAAWLVVPMGLAVPELAAVVSIPCFGALCFNWGAINIYKKEN